MKALSLDLRQRIVAACDVGTQTQKQVAERFGVSESSVKKLLRQRRETGELGTRYANCSAPRKILPEHETKLRELLGERPDMTLEELRDGIGVDCTVQAVHYALLRMGITYKKNAARQRTGP